MTPAPDSTREELVDWLQAMDRNGCWTDEDASAEGFDPLTLAEAWAAVTEMINQD